MEPRDVAHTEELLRRARAVLAYESLDWIVRRPLYDEHGEMFPFFAAAAQGCEIVDSAGRRYVDWANGWGCILLGYRQPEVERAIRDQLSAGPLLSLTHPIEIEVAELLCELVPCAEMAAFCKTGTEAIAGAVRVARAATGRPLVLQHGLLNYRAWDQARTESKGADATPVIGFPYNDLPALHELFEVHAGRVAAILMEPVQHELPAPGYLEGVRELATAHGAALIFDEVVTNFRLARGGAQERFGVIPDLCCLGKAIANGMPLGAIVGRRDWMQRLTSVAFDSTFRGETLSLAAAAATLRIVRDQPVSEHLARVGEALREAFEGSCQALGIAARLQGPPARMSAIFDGLGSRSSHDLRALFLQECMKGGILCTGHFLASYAHDDAALARTIDAIQRALKVVSEAVAAERSAGSGRGPRACQARGFLNFAPAEDESDLRVWGWMLLEDRAPDSIEIVAIDGWLVVAERVARPELAPLYPAVANAAAAGFSARLPASRFASDGNWAFEICARSDDRVVFRCRVRRPVTSSWPQRPRSIADGILTL